MDHHPAFLSAPAEAVKYELDDFFEFEIEQGGQMLSGVTGAVWGYEVKTFIADELFEAFSLSVRMRFGQLPTLPAQTGNLLNFAGVETVEISAVVLEIVAAEKFHEYVRAQEYGSAARSAGHLFDLSLISELSWLNAPWLCQAIHGMFDWRGTGQLAPRSVPQPSEETAAPFDRLAEEVGVGVDLDTAHRETAALLDPLLGGETSMGTWDAAQRRWLVGWWADEDTAPS